MIEKAVKPAKNGCLLNITVQPNSKVSEIKGFNEWRKSLEISVKAPPSGGKANREVEELLKKFFGVKVEIIRGQTSSNKVVFVEMQKEELIRKLKDLHAQS